MRLLHYIQVMGEEGDKTVLMPDDLKHVNLEVHWFPFPCEIMFKLSFCCCLCMLAVCVARVY